MKKTAFLLFLLLLVPSVSADFGGMMGFGSNYGMMTSPWMAWMSIWMTFVFVIISFVFSLIFWLTYRWIILKSKKR